MFVVGWNRNQGEALRVETLEEHIQYNLNAFYENTNASWAMLGVFETKEEARDFCFKMQEIRNARLDSKS